MGVKSGAMWDWGCVGLALEPVPPPWTLVVPSWVVEFWQVDRLFHGVGLGVGDAESSASQDTGGLEIVGIISVEQSDNS